MKKIAESAMYEFHNQYPSLLGVPELRQAVAKHSERCQGIPVDWATETLVTVGATEGIASCFLGLLNPGDEGRAGSGVKPDDVRVLQASKSCNHMCVAKTQIIYIFISDICLIMLCLQ